jgi:hypothetical protein
MNKTQKTLLVTAAVAGLAAGVIANAKVKVGNGQSQNVAGKQTPVAGAIKMGCNGCGKTNKTSAI